ncbi:MAG: TIGR04255 family protein [Thermoguttaceae bacterium]|nr:TIGR04255 family protein [Thermoguttaceae bacterium]
MSTTSDSNNSPNYTNPPVREVAIAFLFNNNCTNEEFTNRINSFIDKVHPDFFVTQKRYKLSPLENNDIDEKPDNEIELKKMVQFEQTLIGVIFHDIPKTIQLSLSAKHFLLKCLRTEGQIPRYNSTRDFTLSRFEVLSVKYEQISSIRLFYRDIIEPKQEEHIDFNTYFNINNDVIPFEGGKLEYFQTVLNISNKIGSPSTLLFAIDQRENSEQQTRFILNWQIDITLNENNAKKDSIVALLDNAHCILSDYFESILNGNCKALFNEE